MADTPPLPWEDAGARKPPRHTRREDLVLAAVAAARTIYQVEDDPAELARALLNKKKKDFPPNWSRSGSSQDSGYYELVFRPPGEEGWLEVGCWVGGDKPFPSVPSAPTLRLCGSPPRPYGGCSWTEPRAEFHVSMQTSPEWDYPGLMVEAVKQVRLLKPSSISAEAVIMLGGTPDEVGKKWRKRLSWARNQVWSKG